jgi:hypothetical protein
MGPARRFCTSCVHYVPPRRVVPFAPGSRLSPGQVRAATEILENEAKLRAIEQQRGNEGLKFDYPPTFRPWCRKYTATPEQVAAVRAGLLAGDDRPYRAAQDHELELIIDFANGTVEAVYVLCSRKNPNGLCAGHEEDDARAAEVRS